MRKQVPETTIDNSPSEGKPLEQILNKINFI